MSLSPLAEKTAWPLGKTPNGANRYTKRPTGRPDMVIVHHAATTSDASLKAAYVARHRELSSNYAMTRDAKLVPILHEEYRPFTSSSPKADGRAITIEIVNHSAAPEWRGSDAQFDLLARAIAEWATRWKFPIDRDHIIMHKEVRPIFGQGIATACPGPWWESRMGALVAKAREYAGQGSPKPPTTKPPTTSKPRYGSSEGLPLYGARIGRRIRMSNWLVWSDPAFRTGRRTVTGEYKVVGITYQYGREARLLVEDSRGGRAWTRALASKTGLIN